MARTRTARPNKLISQAPTKSGCAGRLEGSRQRSRAWPRTGFPQAGKCTTTYSSFVVDAAIGPAQNPSQYRARFTFRARRRSDCATCPDGLCSASIRSAGPVDIGCALMLLRKTIAAIAASCCKTCRHRSVRNSDWGRVLWPAIGPTVARVNRAAAHNYGFYPEVSSTLNR